MINVLTGCMLLMTIPCLIAFQGPPSCLCRNGYPANHTMCRYKPGGPRSNLIIENSVMSLEEEEEVLRVHNELRSELAYGSYYNSTGMPPAQNMKEMVYCKEAARIAQCWAEQCTFAHDQKRNMFGYEEGGQNLAINYVISSEFSPTKFCKYDYPSVVKSWFDEVFTPGFNASSVAPFSVIPGTLHFSQIAWASTRYLGCARICHQDSGKRNKITKFYVCVYQGAGNYIGNNMYEPGYPDCAQHNMVPSQKYHSLCEPSSYDEPQCPDL